MEARYTAFAFLFAVCMLPSASAVFSNISVLRGSLLGACDSSKDWCKDDSTLKPTNDHRCKGSTAVCISGLADWQIQRVVEVHNSYRAHHGACPVTYSKEIEDWSINSPGFKTTCNTGGLQHNSDRHINGVYVGENLYGASGSGWPELQDFDPKLGVYPWYCSEEGCYAYSTGSSSGGTGHFSQVVWKGTTEIGCGLCHKTGSFFRIAFICNYRDGGNIIGQYKANVGSPGEVCNAPPSPLGNSTAAPSPSGPGSTPSVGTPVPGTAAPGTPGATPSPGSSSSGTPAWVYVLVVLSALMLLCACGVLWYVSVFVKRPQRVSLSEFYHEAGGGSDLATQSPYHQSTSL